ncbi:MAG: c-type cytochrome [Sphingobacteriia bacterium]
MKRLLLFLLGLLPGTTLLAAAAEPATTQAGANPLATSELFWFLFSLVALLLVVVIVLVVATIMMLDYFFREKYGYSILPRVSLPKFSLGWSRFTGQKPARANSDQELGHDYDGISELDNAAPPIFNYILYGTVLFAVVYLLVFHVFNAAPLQAEEYDREVKLAELEAEKRATGALDKVTAETVELLTDATNLAAGKAIFQENCVACHGDQGQGVNAPNLTDEYWIHGHTVGNVFNTITVGVQEKGMAAWEGILKPKQRAQVASYILSLPPAKGRAPEGEKAPSSCEAEKDSPADTATVEAKGV